MNAMQEAVDVAGNNVANATTPGYTEERAVLVSEPGVVQAGLGGPVANATLGIGVNVAQVQQVSEGYLNAAVRTAQSNVSYQNQVVQILQDAQGLYNEPSANGLSASMQTFFTDLSTLATTPQSSAARAVVAQDAATVAGAFNTLATGLTGLSTSVQHDLSVQVGQVNQDLAHVASLNQEIANAATQHVQPNTLIDQRNVILGQLSKSLGITVGTNTHGNLTVTDSATGALLVDGQSAGSLATGATLTNAAGSVTASSWQVAEEGLPGTPGTAAPAPVIASITSGQIGADLTLLGSTTYGAGVSPPNTFGALAPKANTAAYGQSLQGQLDQVASALATSINALQMPTGTGAAPAYYLDASGTPKSTAPSTANPTGVPFFVNAAATAQTIPPSGITAANIAVNPAILNSPYEIAAAQSASANDGTNAQAMADLGQSTAPGSAVGRYSAQVSALGVVVQGAVSSQTTGQSLFTQAQSMQESVSGVSINTEFANMNQYQDVYTAAAKVLTAMQAMLQSLLSAVQ
jgi:flagellar hook-associated protein 1 FlgK